MDVHKLMGGKNKVIHDELTPVEVDGKIIKASARQETLLPIFRNTVKWGLIVISSIMILGELGFNITAIIASLGALGLAFAMGSQKLVQDIITGIFLLMENIISVGDVVNVGGGQW